MHARSSLFISTVLSACLAAGCAAAPSSAQPPSTASTGGLSLDLARHEAGSTHFEGRFRRSELISSGRGAEVSSGDSLSVMGGEDGVWKDPVVAASAALRFTFGGGPREGALDLSMDTGPNDTLAFSVDNRLGRDIQLAPIMLRRDAAGVRAVPGKPCRLGNGIILGERLPPGVFAVVVPAGLAPLPDAPACERGHEMFGG